MIDNASLRDSTPGYWGDIRYGDWLAGKYPEVPGEFWSDDRVQYAEGSMYVKQDGRYRVRHGPERLCG